MPPPTYSFDELSSLVDLPARKIRYYIQTGLVDRPDGLNRGARYNSQHIEQLLSIKKWQAAALSLERIRSLLHDDPVKQPPPPVAGTIEIWSRLHVARGIELHVEAGVAGLTPEQLRQLLKQVLLAYQEMRTPERGNDHE
jgi:DNA-binding transcriptional MerR regulator